MDATRPVRHTRTPGFNQLLSFFYAGNASSEKAPSATNLPDVKYGSFGPRRGVEADSVADKWIKHTIK